jgi:UDP-N-acetylglucosamine 2-epimerase (non-hydrolysing)
VQEEAPSLKKPLLILRESTERPEAIESGVARLVGHSPERLAAMLDEVYRDGNWIRCIGAVENPFGTGDSGERIVDIVGQLLARNGAR